MPAIEARSPKQREEAFTLYRAGRTPRQISDALGVPEITIYTWKRRHDWDWRASTPTTAFERGEDLSFAEQRESYKGTMATQAMRIAHVISTTPDATLLSAADKVEKLDRVARKALDLERPEFPVIVNIGLLAGGSPPAIASKPALPR